MTLFGIRSVGHLQEFLSDNLPSLVLAFTVASTGTVIAVDRLTTRVTAQEEVSAKLDRYIDIHTQEHYDEREALVQEHQNMTLMFEEQYQKLDRRMQIRFLEADIIKITGDISILEFELARLNRINQGLAAAPGTEETLQAERSARERLSAAEARMASKVRELNRIMQFNNDL